MPKRKTPAIDSVLSPIGDPNHPSPQSFMDGLAGITPPPARNHRAALDPRERIQRRRSTLARDARGRYTKESETR